MRCEKCGCTLFSCQCPQGPTNALIEPPCIFCGQPRHESQLTCAAPTCREQAQAMPTAALNAIRQREGIEALRRGGRTGGEYIHLTPRRD